MIAIGTQFAHDVFEVFALLATLCREAHDRSSGIGYALDLRNTRWGIGSGGVGHRLYHHRVVASDADFTDLHLATISAYVLA